MAMTSNGSNDNPDLSLSSYGYQLDPDRIAQHPVEPRDSARLLVVESRDRHSHRIFRDLAELLEPGDVLAVNDSRVIPARLYGRKPSGAEVEVLLLEERGDNCWLALVRPGKRLKPGAKICFETGDGSTRLWAKVLCRDEETAGRLLQFDVPDNRPLLQWLDDLGRVPLPPYINAPDVSLQDYQTVYARQPGSAAAPTAGLHFTEELLQRLGDRGIDIVPITLHVGVGTFRPVEREDITTHHMHSEWAQVSEDTVARLQAAKARGGRIFGVGTTVIRALETAAASGTLAPYCGKTDLFIYPGYRWKAIDGIITNFHLPHSSLMMLVAAFVGRERLLALYQTAIEENYRFYSFGDAMLLCPDAKIESAAPASKTPAETAGELEDG